MCKSGYENNRFLAHRLQSKSGKILFRRLIINGVVLVCGFAWIFYSSILYSDIHIMIYANVIQSHTQTRRNRLEGM